MPASFSGCAELESMKELMEIIEEDMRAMKEGYELKIKELEVEIDSCKLGNLRIFRSLDE
jgi:hypothetical protein